MRNFLVILVAFIIALTIISCSSDTEFTAPSKVKEPSTEQETNVEEIIPVEPDTTEPILQYFNVGETASDEELKVTINDVKFVTEIDEKDNEFMIAEAPEGKVYAVLDVTIENILTDKTQTISTFGETLVKDQDGYDYSIDLEALVALDKAFKDGEVLPGMKKRGQIAYLVPSEATDLKFIYKFDLFTGTSAVYDIK